MKCALWLNGKKVFKAQEIVDNFDISAIRGYFLGGCLYDWLVDNEGEKYIDKILNLSHSDEKLNERLMEIFGQNIQEINLHKHTENKPNNNTVTSSPTSFYSTSYNSFFVFGSFIYGSFSYGSHQFEYEFEFERGSFGSYRLGSFYIGSFKPSSFITSFDFLSSFYKYNISSFFNNTSYFISDDKYDDLVRLSFELCPLNMFGYGIHNI